VLSHSCLISQLGRRESGEQGLECRLVGADERVCLRRKQHGLVEPIVRLRYRRQVAAENRGGSQGPDRINGGAEPCRVDVVHPWAID
jgi:hypothetical protein